MTSTAKNNSANLRKTDIDRLEWLMHYLHGAIGPAEKLCGWGREANTLTEMLNRARTEFKEAEVQS